jgi:hypothetical protein
MGGKVDPLPFLRFLPDNSIGKSKIHNCIISLASTRTRLYDNNPVDYRLVEWMENPMALSRAERKYQREWLARKRAANRKANLMNIETASLQQLVAIKNTGTSLKDQAILDAVQKEVWRRLTRLEGETREQQLARNKAIA